MDKRRQVILLAIILVFVVLTISRCAPDLPDEFPEPERGEVDSLPPAQQRPEITIGPDESLIEGQIMLTGASANVEELVETVRTLEGLELRPLVSTTFTFLNEFRPPESGDTDIRQQPLGKRQHAGDPLAGRLQDDISSLEIAIYDYPEETHSITETLQLIASVAVSLDGPVVAEPNYVTGFEITGSPWGVEGSPWGVEGSPWGVEGSAGSGSDPDPDVKIASDEFWEQWALGDWPGINLLGSPDPLDGRKISTRGRDVEVAVFDTSPFDGPGVYTFTNWGPDDSIDPLTVSVLHPLTLPQSATDTENDATRSDISDHGLFVSGLVYAVAPESEVRLIQVLNDQGQGEVQGLIDALNIYMLDRLGSNGGTLENTVINLSLGTHTPDDDELSDEAQEQIALMLERWGYRLSEDEPLPVYALDVMMDLFERYGATVIAASGNHSADEARALPPQYPAAVSTVRGVSASSKTPDQSCYANDGDLMAPGGDGGNGDADGDGVYDAAPTDGNSCVPSHMTCSGDGPECGFGVVSYTQKGHRGFAYWVGTSFATPLVSGLAANVIEAGDGLPDDLRPGDVRDVLDCSAEANGVVDVLEALNRCLPSP